MLRAVAIIGILLIAFVALASLQMLPEPIQKPVNEIAGKLLPQKALLEKNRSEYEKAAEGTGK